MNLSMAHRWDLRRGSNGAGSAGPRRSPDAAPSPHPPNIDSIDGRDGGMPDV